MLASSEVRHLELKPKALVPPVAMSTRCKSGDGVMEGTCPRAVKSDLHSTGFLGVEGIPASANALPFAG
jgi:hypothetical protein